MDCITRIKLIKLINKIESNKDFSKLIRLENVSMVNLSSRNLNHISPKLKERKLDESNE